MRVEKKPETVPAATFVPAQPTAKVVMLAAFTVAATALTWLAWHNALVTGLNFSDWLQLIFVIGSTLAAFCLMFVAAALMELLVTNRWVTIGTAVLAALTAFIFFAITLWSLIGVVLMILAFVYWRRELRIDMESRTKFLPLRTLEHGLGAAVTLILLALSLMYYSYLISNPQWQDSLVSSIAANTAGVVHTILEKQYDEEYRPDMTLDQFIGVLSPVDADQSIEVETGREEFDRIIEEGITEAQAEIIAQSRDEFLETFRIEATGEETMDTVVQRILTRNIERYVEPLGNIIPALLALSVFFLLRIFGFVYRTLIRLLMSLAYHVLRWLGFIGIQKVTVEGERVTLE